MPRAKRGIALAPDVTADDDDSARGLPPGIDLAALSEIAAATERGPLAARAVLKGCEARADERVAVLADDDTDRILRDIFFDSVLELGEGSDPAVVTLRPRDPAYEGLPALGVDALLSAQLVLDLTTMPWTFSDSFAHFAAECPRTGTRLAYIGGDADGIASFLACPPSPKLRGRATRGLEALQQARTVHVRSSHGTDFTVELGDPDTHPRRLVGIPVAEPGAIGAPLSMAVTAPFVPGTARGTVAFRGAGRFQTPFPEPFWADRSIRLRFADGRLGEVARDNEAGEILAAWLAEADAPDASLAVDCCFGFDPRGRLESADDLVVHSFDGGFMIGVGKPDATRPDGTRVPGSHLDLMLSNADVDLDGHPFIRNGSDTRQSACGESRP